VIPEAAVKRHTPFLLRIVLLLLLTSSALIAIQQEQQEEKKTAPQQLSPAARLAAAKTALLRKSGSGSDIAYDVVSSTLEGWGRFTLVHEPEKADVIVEVFTVEETEGGISASSGPGRGRPIGRSRQGTIAMIKLTVYDAKTHIALWTGAERPKGAMKKVDRENNEVEAAQRLVTKFHDDVEPPQK
jgi:hypothetical protein